MSGRTRRPGGGRKKLTETDPTLLADLQNLVEPTTRGDPMAPLLWTSRSLRNLADALQAMGHRIKHNVVGDLLRQLGYSLQSNRKTREGAGSNGARARLWKRELQLLADELGLAITVCHLPPGTSKWNKIEHRLFSFSTQNWRGKPLVRVRPKSS